MITLQIGSKTKKIKDRNYDFKTIDSNLDLLAKWFMLYTLDYDGYNEKSNKKERMPAKNIEDVKYHVKKEKDVFTGIFSKSHIRRFKKDLKNHHPNLLYDLTRRVTKEYDGRCHLPWLILK